jgi:hypothetical protein
MFGILPGTVGHMVSKSKRDTLANPAKLAVTDTRKEPSDITSWEEVRRMSSGLLNLDGAHQQETM